MPPDRQTFELADQQARHLLDALSFLGHFRLLGGRIVERMRPAEQWHFGFHVIDLVERTHDREDEVRVVQPGGNRHGEGVPYPGQQLAVDGIGHAWTGPAGGMTSMAQGSSVRRIPAPDANRDRWKATLEKPLNVH